MAHEIKSEPCPRLSILVFFYVLNASFLSCSSRSACILVAALPEHQFKERNISINKKIEVISNCQISQLCLLGEATKIKEGFF